MKTWIVTGGAGFIGSNFILMHRRRGAARIINLDKLTYAGNLANLEDLRGDAGYQFVRGDVADRALVGALLREHRPDAVIHLAAESHVDRSIQEPGAFIRTNVVGTFCLLDEVLGYWRELPGGRQEAFRFLHVSTDEVYGSLGPEEPPFTEDSPHRPNSPYAASKAGSDHLVRAYNRTYGLPTLTTNCSNNYGPYQFPEKLIPLMTINALAGKPLPIYGDGGNVRDWLFVEDHCEALAAVLEAGRPGETYNVGGRCELANLELVRTLCRLLDQARPDSPHVPHELFITFVPDRPGHDRRYATDCTRIGTELGWRPRESFQSGLEKTLRWYMEHGEWVDSVQSGEYTEWIGRQYGTQ